MSLLRLLNERLVMSLIRKNLLFQKLPAVPVAPTTPSKPEEPIVPTKPVPDIPEKGEEDVAKLNNELLLAYSGVEIANTTFEVVMLSTAPEVDPYTSFCIEDKDSILKSSGLKYYYDHQSISNSNGPTSNSVLETAKSDAKQVLINLQTKSRKRLKLDLVQIMIQSMLINL